MNAARDLVYEEWQRFQAALPGLLERYRGRWVVFNDGEVVSDHGDEDAAYRAGLEAFGLGGNYVVARVEDIEPVPVTASVFFV